MLPARKKTKSTNAKFAKLMIANIGVKLSKQEKDKQLILCIKRDRREIIEKLMKESCNEQATNVDDKID